MPDIHILRPHALGLPDARQAAQVWAEKAERKFGMACRYEEGEQQDCLHFSRAGVQGTLRVDAGQFVLNAELGFLFGAFQERIEAEIQAQLDKLLEGPPPANAHSTAPAPDA